MSAGKRIVIVDDDVLIASYLCDVCEDHNGTVVGMAHRAEDALDLILETRPEFVLMDVRLGGPRDGVDIATDVYRHTPDIKIVYVTGSSEPQTIRRINADHPHTILIKPIAPAQLVEALGIG
ncbi:response regulator [Jiella marina]|uniref:response regulator n=1 Tax=Jiella sp. LLJ827 TaxID=2917712 RepID=UPI0021016CBC|nr:response regulator [Jiella sp. LLJ827]MCQ0987403.1 response regulator [Jiella sp. LLJ827]